MLGKEIGKNIVGLLNTHNESFSSSRPQIKHLRVIISKYFKICAKCAKGKKVSDKDIKFKKNTEELISDLNLAIEAFNNEVNSIIYRIRGSEEGFPFEELCLVLEGSILTQLDAISFSGIMDGLAKSFLKQFDDSSFNKRVGDIKDVVMLDMPDVARIVHAA